MTIDPFHVRRVTQLSGWSDADFDLDELTLPDEPQWHRCGAVHCIDQRPVARNTRLLRPEKRPRRWALDVAR